MQAVRNEEISARIGTIVTLGQDTEAKDAPNLLLNGGHQEIGSTAAVWRISFPAPFLPVFIFILALSSNMQTF